MTLPSTPYDEVPYRSYPIEWTAPEHLALASMLHGGPRIPLDAYRVLELGCGDGTNLIPMAYFRRHANFVGVDGARTQIAIANEKRTSLTLDNVTFVLSDFRSAAAGLSGQFDFIIAHGVFSWVSVDNRNALLALCAERLRPGGLIYLNYNARPGWNVRGLVRDFLLSQTVCIAGLRARTERARDVAQRMAEELQGGDHPYSQLLAREFRLVGELDPSLTAHDYLSEHNDAFTRRAFLDLVAGYGLACVADADFSYPSGRLPEALPGRLAALKIDAESMDEAADLLCYRQLHSPILTQFGFARRQPDIDELSELFVASCLVDCGAGDGDHTVVFAHPSGYEVEARSQSIAAALKELRRVWPRGLPLAEVFAEVGEVIDDVKLLHRNGMIELRVSDDAFANVDSEPLNRFERSWGEHVTTPRHTVEPAEFRSLTKAVADPIR